MQGWTLTVAQGKWKTGWVSRFHHLGAPGNCISLSRWIEFSQSNQLFHQDYLHAHRTEFLVAVVSMFCHWRHTTTSGNQQSEFLSIYSMLHWWLVTIGHIDIVWSKAVNQANNIWFGRQVLPAFNKFIKSCLSYFSWEQNDESVNSGPLKIVLGP